MTASTEPRGGLDLGWISGEDGWGGAMNANLLRLSRLGFHPSVLSATIATPPGSPVSGSGYIIPSGATGVWAGKTGQVAIWDGAAWAYAAPRDGWTMHVDGAGLTTYDGGSWSQANVATAAGVGALAASLKGAANGVAELGADAKVPAAQLPSSALLALGADSTTAHRGDHGTTAYTHSQIATGNPHGTTAADVGAMASTNPEFTGALKQGGTPRITSGGDAWFASVQSTNLVGVGDRPVAADLTGTLQPKTPSQARSLIGAAKSPSKLNVSTSTTLGAIDASAIKVTTTDVILTLSGGVDGQGWDIINPTTATGIAIPSGATLWKSNGFDVGPTTISLGGGRPIRITRIDANTWTMLGSQ